MAISSIIKSVQDIMRQDAGVDGDAQRISQLVWMIFLKVFDDKEYEYELDSSYTPFCNARFAALRKNRCPIPSA